MTELRHRVTEAANEAWRLGRPKLYAAMFLVAVILFPTGLHFLGITTRARSIYVMLWREVEGLARRLACNTRGYIPTTLTGPIKRYRITGNKTQFIGEFALAVSLVFDPETLGIWRVRVGRNGTVVRTNYPNQPDQVLGMAFAFYCAYEITANRTYLEWARALVERAYECALVHRLFTFHIWSNGTVWFRPAHLCDQLPACCYLAWFGLRLGNESWVRLAEEVWERLWSYARPLLPAYVGPDGEVTNERGLALHYAVPCCLAQLMFDYPLLRRWAGRLINYYYRVMALEPDGRFLMHQNCWADGTPLPRRIYRLAILTNHIRFLCAYAHLTGNMTVVKWAQHLADFAMTHMRAPYGYVERLDAKDLSVLKTRIMTGYITKFITGLMWLYRVTGNATYAKEAIWLIKLMEDNFMTERGVHRAWDAITGEVLDYRLDRLIDPLNEWLYLLCTMPHGGAICLTPANFQYKYVLPHFGNVSLLYGVVQVRYRVPEGANSAEVELPFEATAIIVNGTRLKTTGGIRRLRLPEGTWLISILYRPPSDGGAVTAVLLRPARL